MSEYARRRAALGALMVLALGLLAPEPAQAHPVRLGLLSIDEGDAGVVDLRLHLSGTEREPTGGLRVLPTSCRATTTPEHIALRVGSELRQRFHCPGGLAGARLGVDELPRGGVQVLLRYSLHGELAFEALLDDTAPTRVLPTQPTTVGVFGRYLRLGVEHILTGFDHLLFVLGLLLLVDGRRRLLLTITSFTVGHSVTLALATLGLLSVPARATEAAIALSILLLAVELTHPRAGASAPAPARPLTLTRRWPWLVAALFGLLHGLGFAGALREIGLPSSAVPAALFAFNLGVELGQLAFVATILGLGAALSRLPQLARFRLTLTRWALPYVLGVAASYLLCARVASFFSA